MSRLRRWILGLVIAAAVAMPMAYFAIGAVATYRVDDDLTNVVPVPIDKPIQIARTFEKILTREIEDNNWQPSSPWFYPNAWTDDGKNFQLGVLHGLRRTVLEYASRTIRLRQDGSLDRNLQNALNQLQYPPGVWVLDLSQGFGASSPSQYRAALEFLRAFEDKSKADSYAELRADQLLRFVDALNVDLTSHVATLQDYASKASFFDAKADDLFYQTKGAGFVYAALAPAIQHDFATVFEQKHLNDLWNQLEVSLGQLAAFKPAIVMTGAPNGVIFPNNLLTQGFYAARCSQILMQIEEILRA